MSAFVKTPASGLEPAEEATLLSIASAKALEEPGARSNMAKTFGVGA